VVNGDGSSGAVGSPSLPHPRRHVGQLAPVAGAELAQQRRHVALDGAHRDEQAGTDLGVAQMLAERGKHLRLPCRDARLWQRPGLGHAVIVPLERHGAVSVVDSVARSVVGTDVRMRRRDEACSQEQNTP
jgi:hypothetical protein